MLAGMERSSSPFEVEDFFQRAARELELKESSKDVAIRSYSIDLAQQIISDEIPIREGVRRLYGLCLAGDYPSYLMIWSDLDDALADVEYGYEPHRYPGLTRESSKETVVKEARAFVESARRS
jgi:hypothetical protein